MTCSSPVLKVQDRCFLCGCWRRSCIVNQEIIQCGADFCLIRSSLRRTCRRGQANSQLVWMCWRCSRCWTRFQSEENLIMNISSPSLTSSERWYWVNFILSMPFIKQWLLKKDKVRRFKRGWIKLNWWVKHMQTTCSCSSWDKVLANMWVLENLLSSLMVKT